MELLVDLFGYLSVVVHGLVIVAQSVAVGSVVFLTLLVRPRATALGGAGPDLADAIAQVAAWAAIGLVVTEGATLAMEAAVLMATADLALGDVLTASFALAGLVKCAAAAMLAALLLRSPRRAPTAALVTLAVIILVAATMNTHAIARMEDRPPLLVAEFLHQLGAALWIGGIPAFVMALSRTGPGTSLAGTGRLFSRVSMAGVTLLLLSGTVMAIFYVGSLQGFYGTAYGVMVGAKIALFLILLALGAGNFLVVERLQARASAPYGRMRRFAEAEIGIGFTVFFAAASLTSVPPAVDLSADRVTWAEIQERFTPRLPRIASPDHDALALSALQSTLDSEAREQSRKPSPAFVPGAGELPPRNAADIAWSEYNHHWAGFFLLAVGLMALAAQAGWRAGRHWPLLFLGLGAFLAIRADPEVWPLGSEGLIESLRDVEVLQHRMFVLVILAFAIFEWRVRIRGLRTGWQPLVFPLMCAFGGALLLTHQHAIANVKDQMLIELSHTPLAICAVVAGWSRWLELRLDPAEDGRVRTAAAWTWPIGLLMIGVILVLYREA